MAANNLRIRTPQCPLCRGPVMPLALFFDELYESHASFRYRHALDWLQSADVIVYVGTSFSVGVTATAARQRRAAVQLPHAQRRAGRCEFVPGRCEETLPRLYQRVQEHMLAVRGAPQLFLLPRQLPLEETVQH